MSVANLVETKVRGYMLHFTLSPMSGGRHKNTQCDCKTVRNRYVLEATLGLTYTLVLLCHILERCYKII